MGDVTTFHSQTEDNEESNTLVCLFLIKSYIILIPLPQFSHSQWAEFMLLSDLPNNTSMRSELFASLERRPSDGDTAGNAAKLSADRASASC